MSEAMKRSGAVLSDDGVYRYSLWRVWDESKPKLLWIGLNPSTADATEDDPTIRRCIDFTKRNGGGSLYAANLFAFRATDPKALLAEMAAGRDVSGPQLDEWLQRMAYASTAVIACWGAHKAVRERAKYVLSLLDGVRFTFCLGKTKDGHPKHPLYVKADTPLIDFP